MPITSLNYTHDGSDVEMEIGVLFDHLLACKTNEHPVSLHLEWMWPIKELSSISPGFQEAEMLGVIHIFSRQGFRCLAGILTGKSPRISRESVHRCFGHRRRS
ncbi:hypothetical protein AVEN_184354-1 [Araneus ventricosus]|uniref:Uncharacterized protein n=1 Tax=Araneus ventricosus TaxID=182803 RepID=A0A4Y2JL70_ARAVE|nr:hypothetical protein AVEN_17330-1 [Araneus ventricosus]GBM90726.1 hypothetical protein AVEN_184354-1 [Araneus ventricosus]